MQEKTNNKMSNFLLDLTNKQYDLLVNNAGSICRQNNSGLAFFVRFTEEYDYIYLVCIRSEQIFDENFSLVFECLIKEHKEKWLVYLPIETDLKSHNKDGENVRQFFRAKALVMKEQKREVVNLNEFRSRLESNNFNLMTRDQAIYLLEKKKWSSPTKIKNIFDYLDQQRLITKKDPNSSAKNQYTNKAAGETEVQDLLLVNDPNWSQYYCQLNPQQLQLVTAMITPGSAFIFSNHPIEKCNFNSVYLVFVLASTENSTENKQRFVFIKGLTKQTINRGKFINAKEVNGNFGKEFNYKGIVVTQMFENKKIDNLLTGVNCETIQDLRDYLFTKGEIKLVENANVLSCLNQEKQQPKSLEKEYSRLGMNFI